MGETSGSAMMIRTLTLLALLGACVASSRSLLGSSAMVKDCKPELAACEADADCKAMLECVSLECAAVRSSVLEGPRIKRAKALSARLGEPYSPMICDKSCYDDYGYGNGKWVSFSACGGRAGGIRAPAKDSQQCIQHPKVLQPFNMSALSGEWWKVWNHGWDFWQCHRHIYTFLTDTWRQTWGIEVKFQVQPLHHSKPSQESIKLIVVPNIDDQHGNLPVNASFTMLPYFHMGADTYESHYVLAMTHEYVIAAACVYTIEMARTDAVVYILAKTPVMTEEVEDKVRQQLIRLDLNASTFVTVNNTQCIG